jgi:hypothetical protein
MNRELPLEFLFVASCSAWLLIAPSSRAQAQMDRVTLVNQASREVSYRIGYPADVRTSRMLAPGATKVWLTQGAVVCVVDETSFELRPHETYAFRDLQAGGDTRIVRLAQGRTVPGQGQTKTRPNATLDNEPRGDQPSALTSEIARLRSHIAKLEAQLGAADQRSPTESADVAARRVDTRALETIRPAADELVVLSWPSGIDTYIRSTGGARIRHLQYLGRTPLACRVPAGVHAIVAEPPGSAKGQWSAPGTDYFRSASPGDIAALLQIEVEKDASRPALVRLLWLEDDGTPAERLTRATRDSGDLFKDGDMRHLHEALIRGLVPAQFEPNPSMEQQLAAVLRKSGYARFLLPNLNAAVDFELTGNLFRPGPEKAVKYRFVRGDRPGRSDR